MLVLNYLWIIPALPLLGAAVNGIFARHWPKRQVDAVGVGSATLAFAAALELTREFARLRPEQIPWVKSYFTWIGVGSFRAEYALQVDQLTIVMLLVVTGVGWLIHIYSTGYMAEEGGYYRFFAEMNLFMFFMVTLVMAANFVLLFVGWEGVGLCSYLLIGFFFLKKTAADAGKKAFIVTRIGDFGFLLGILLTFRAFGSVDFASVFRAAASMPVESLAQYGVLTSICLLLLAGAVGKSAQLPLYVWLPDAMEGPTPVSALIHAATMVAAGVYMVARMHVLYEHAPLALLAVAVIGCLTAFYSATIGLVQTDIKKILAYSTISQLGYMFLGCGVGAFAAGIFHLMTHAFFKALLFLAAGSVIHALGGEQDLRRMGGLWKKIPWTYGTMLAATLAIAGAPFFSGFFSKDKILYETLESPYGGAVLWFIALLGALLTAFYMFRLVFLAFHGAPRYAEHGTPVHESPRNMLAPLVVLAILSVVGGWMAAPALWGGRDHFESYLAPVFGSASPAEAATAQGNFSELQSSIIATGVALAGFLVAWWFYIRRPQTPERLTESFPRPYKLLLGKYYVDELYDRVIVRPFVWISTRVLWQVVEEAVVDGSVNGVAHTARRFGERVRLVQSGNTRSYAAWVVVGAVLVMALLLWPLLRPLGGMAK
ncbi:MAG TPA: NADH-quinone oxidoreductase subunit L [Candidatus Acidoferrales bacterium]|nr:NADH-quinone oxidoreductase subunit L [Candidatus Acidoferrales bacterium]